VRQKYAIMGHMTKLASMPARLARAGKIFQQLGLRQSGFFALYQLELSCGYLRWATRPVQVNREIQPEMGWLPLPVPGMLDNLLGADGTRRLLAEADEITGGKVRLFGGEPVELSLVPVGELAHWTAYERGQHNQSGEDIKFTWEPGRFGWAYTLGRAFQLSGDERYPAAFWRFAEEFLQANPACMGPQWSSAQEVALRLMAFSFALRVFAGSAHTTAERVRRLAQAIGEHAGRIPATLAYARAQNNNHLLSEAAGLYTAGLVLPGHPAAERWRWVGWKLFNDGLQAQIAEDGAYAQHSSNYQRLMLQLALWMRLSAGSQGLRFPVASEQRLAAATRWLAALVDPVSGRTPNLGPNDGAYILPLSVCPYDDYRPVLQAACLALRGEKLTADGLWDEMSLWLCPSHENSGGMPAISSLGFDVQNKPSTSPHLLRSPGSDSWAYVRAARFHSRPGHADQLHLDLWWRGLNIAQDAGTYLYNGQPPWDNALTDSAVHNTVTVNGMDQMTPAGRFLYLDWAQASVLATDSADRHVGGQAVADPDGAWQRLTAQHDGYRRLGVLHRRIVTAQAGPRWLVEDILMADMASRGASNGQNDPAQVYTTCLNWLLPDWHWEVDTLPVRRGSQTRLTLHSPYGPVRLDVTVYLADPAGEAPRLAAETDPGMDAPALQLVRAGEVVYGGGTAATTWGWVSPTYGVKVPALAAHFNSRGRLPLQFSSNWVFPEAME
jgi:hypothetical protein